MNRCKEVEDILRSTTIQVTQQMSFYKKVLWFVLKTEGGPGKGKWMKLDEPVDVQLSFDHDTESIPIAKINVVNGDHSPMMTCKINLPIKDEEWGFMKLDTKIMISEKKKEKNSTILFQFASSQEADEFIDYLKKASIQNQHFYPRSSTSAPPPSDITTKMQEKMIPSSSLFSSSIEKKITPKLEDYNLMDQDTSIDDDNGSSEESTVSLEESTVDESSVSISSHQLDPQNQLLSSINRAYENLTSTDAYSHHEREQIARSHIRFPMIEVKKPGKIFAPLIPIQRNLKPRPSPLSNDMTYMPNPKRRCPEEEAQCWPRYDLNSGASSSNYQGSGTGMMNNSNTLFGNGGMIEESRDTMEKATTGELDTSLTFDDESMIPIYSQPYYPTQDQQNQAAISMMKGGQVKRSANDFELAVRKIWQGWDDSIEDQPISNEFKE